MTLLLKLNLMERRHQRLRERLLKANKNLEISYLVQYTTPTGGIGQTYVSAESDKEAVLAAKKAAKTFHGIVLSVNKSLEMYYNKKTNRFEKKDVGGGIA